MAQHDNESLIAGPWSGGVTSAGAEIKAVVKADAGAVRLLLGRDAAMTGARALEARNYRAAGYAHRIVSFTATELEPDTRYHYALEIAGCRLAEKAGQFVTFPVEGTPAEFKFVFASCASTGSNSRVFRAVLDESPLFFCHLGDFHYENVNTTDIGPHLDAMDEALRAERQAALYRGIPIARVWDDHDFCGNDSDGGKKGRPAAIEAFHQFTPHYPFRENGATGIHQAFTVGRVRFLLCDVRSQRSARDQADTGAKTMLGAAQKAWLKEELAAAGQYDLVVWANPVPWIEAPCRDEDSWAGYHTERVELASFIKQHNVRNLCMISGDAHMLAIDSGQNSGYAEGGKGGFPVFHAASLKSSPSEKGGRYSERAFKGDRQYGVFETRYLNGVLHIFWTGRQFDPSTEQAKTRITYRFQSPGTFQDF
jgi:phosphodiesterase/alkaline phosphatase D-like protein